MMALVTFFNRWLKVKLLLDAKDWPETHDNDPEPYTDEEAAKLEAESVGEINLLIRTFRQTGCRDMKISRQACNIRSLPWFDSSARGPLAMSRDRNFNAT